MAERLKFFADAVLLSYSKIFFSDSRLLGIIAVASTLPAPMHCVFGLLGAFFSTAAAYIIGMDRQAVGKGMFGFNGALTGLGLSLFYDSSLELVFILLMAAILLTFLTILMNNTFSAYLGLPAMSMPFTIIIWLVLLAGVNSGHLRPSAAKWTLFSPVFGYAPHWADIFFSNIGAILFQANLLSGIIISAGILIYSRIAFVLMTAGFVVAEYAQDFFYAGDLPAGVKWLGFNYMLSALAIGGVFIIPGSGSFCLALVAAIISAIIAASAHTLLPGFLSPLALPFNLSVFLVLYGLRSRIYPSLGVRLTAGEIRSPEENLSAYKEGLLQSRRMGLKISLPFYGVWKVSQSIDGEYTHKDAWRFAYDFQAIGSNGMTYKNNGTLREDFYSYGLPVTAPAGGMVYAVKDGVSDNLIGKINTVDNWGNYIIIGHAADYFSCICHLKQGSVRVSQGQSIAKGEVIALCGNSGRSPYPHIHIQFQANPYVGSPSIYFEFSNFLIIEDGAIFSARDAVRQGSLVQNMAYHPAFESFFPYSMNKLWHYRHGSSVETWTMNADLYGNTFLASSPLETRLYYKLSEGVLSIDKLEGDRGTGLYLFGSAITDAPLPVQGREIRWTAPENSACGIKPACAGFFDIFFMLGIDLKRDIKCSERYSADEIILKTASNFFLETPFGRLRLKRKIDSEIIFKKGVGVEKARSDGKEISIFGSSAA